MTTTLSEPEHSIAATTTAKDKCYRVWAPDAKRMALQVENEVVPLTSRPDGWWTADRAMKAGEVYGYIVNDDGPFPDPRSMCQPSGVHGLSQCVDHSAFEWSDQGWQAPPLPAAVIYELHIGTFSESGTFDGAIAKLPHLARLGITHVELMPVAEFSGTRGWGYDGVDLFAPHHAYGTPADLKRLVDASHAHGLGVLLDVVYNHFGPAGNYLSRFGPYFTHRHNTPWGDAVNLDDAGSDEVRRFFCDNAVMWLRDYHFDGLRLDAIHALVDTSATHFLEQLTCEVEVLEATLGRHLVLIAESDLNDPRIIRSREAGGYGMDAQWSDDFHHALHSLITGERSGYYEDFGTLAHFARALQAVFVYAGNHSRHRQRVHGRAAHNLPGWRFVVTAQNHDQIGNRATGERLSHLASTGRSKIAAGLLLSAPFVPMLFQGEEWGASSPFQYFTSHEDGELGAAVSEGRRREFAAFGWDPATVPDPQSVATFERSRLHWDELAVSQHAGLLEWHSALLALRRTCPDLRDGNYQNTVVSFCDVKRQLVIRRGLIVVACNLGELQFSLDIPHARTVLLASERGVCVRDGNVTVPAEAIVFVQLASSAE